MPIFSSENTTTIAARVPVDLETRVVDFAAASGLTKSAALRILIERGLDSDLDPSELEMLSFNAKAEAVRELDQVISEAVERFFER